MRSPTAASGSREPGRCTFGCSGAIEVAFELSSVAASERSTISGVLSEAVGWLTDLWGVSRFRRCVFDGIDGFSSRNRVFVGDTRSELLRNLPSDFLDLGRSLILTFSLSSSSSSIVSAAAGFPPSFRLPGFLSVRGGLGGAFPTGTVFKGDSLVLDALRSVAGGVKMSIPVRGTTASLLCCLENVG